MPLLLRLLCVFLSTQAALCAYSEEMLRYLEDFNYLPKQTGAAAMLSGSTVEEALKELQRYGRIPATGKMDSETIKLMARKRCGLGDRQPHRHRRHKKRFALGPKWHKNILTYSVENTSRRIRDLGLIRREVSAAISTWQQVTPIRFLEVSPDTEADIRVKFAVGDHRDGFPFDGTGRVLAHAFPPGGGPGGDVHLDDDEYWTLDLFGDPISSLVSLRAIVLHELGHSLGLSHSYEEDSIMYAFYQHSLPPQLALGDVKAIQTLYGRKSNPTDYYPKYPETTVPPRTTRPTITRRYYHREPPGHTTPSPLIPDLCQTNIDAVTRIRGEYFVFKDEWLWRFHKDGRLSAGGRSISSYWPKLTSRIDGAVEDGRFLIFFSGDKYYVYDGHTLISENYLTDLGLPSTAKRIRLVYSWNYWPDKPIYIWIGDEYWKLDRKSGKVELGYPRKISSVWHNIPEESSAAATINNELYFFFGSKAARFHSINMTAGAPFPVYRLWRHCPEPLNMPSGSVRFPISNLLLIVSVLFCILLAQCIAF